MAQVQKNAEGNSRIIDAQGNTIYPCGYRGGAKDRMSAPAEFEESTVSLQSQVRPTNPPLARPSSPLTGTRVLPVSTLFVPATHRICVGAPWKMTERAKIFRGGPSSPLLCLCCGAEPV